MHFDQRMVLAVIFSCLFATVVAVYDRELLFIPFEPFNGNQSTEFLLGFSDGKRLVQGQSPVLRGTMFDLHATESPPPFVT